MFMERIKQIINTGQSRVIILTGNIYDLFKDGVNYVPLLEYLSAKCRLEPTASRKGITQLIYKLNNPIECRGDQDEAFRLWHETAGNRSLADRFIESNRNATYALELLRQITEAYRRSSRTKNNLLIIVEAADLLIPECEINRMSLADRQRVAIVHDWFSDPAFINGGDTVILLAESRSQIHHRIARLPQIISVDIPLPDLATRTDFIWGQVEPPVPKMYELTAGLSIHAIRQLLKSGDVSEEAISAKVEEYMVSQLGDGVVEFKRPTHTLKDVIGFTRIKEFMKNELIPGFQEGHISGAAVGGPIGGGKTFICEAVAAELGIPVITLKNIRSKWYGETDQIFERLKRLLETFHRSVIFVDEADTQFGGIEDDHPTERRLTGKIQGMMSDVVLKGRVIWFLMTARIHRLSPDIRRPGRMDLILPILDPEGEDRKEFIRWCLGEWVDSEENLNLIDKMTEGFSAAAFTSLRSQIKLKKPASWDDISAICDDMVLPDITEVREYQILQAKLNCTRKSLLFSPKEMATMREPGMLDYDHVRKEWKSKLEFLERQGIK